jgi:3,4-dihydroxy 2-butanone 4-phosphate synthase/GTP cyclohydrolase II
MSLEHPIYGTTLYLGKMPLKTRFGEFTCYTFQNLIHKGHIMALTYGNLKNEFLYTRVHSSCVTSETLRSMDCDCVKQLEGAFKKIAEMGHGVLFYLIQEGRGCGYVGKSRACMMVQYHNDKITTFDAYKNLGMKNDYRDYRNIGEMAHLLGIHDANFILLSNNPDKINALQEIGLKVAKVESIEYPPGPFNQSYLVSKAQTGHLLYQTKHKVSKYSFPHQRVRPFIPYGLPGAARFIHCATYSVPIRPVNNCMVFTAQEMKKCKVPYKIVEQIDDVRYFLQFEEKDLEQIEIRPYWFRVYMYYDLASSSDFVVLSYGDVEGKVPLVRIHSESLFNRFPLQETLYRNKYKHSLEKIVRNNSGIIVLLYHDGRGAGLGHYVLNHMELDGPTGVKADTRDFHAAALLLKHHLKRPYLKILYSDSSRDVLQKEFDQQEIQVLEWIDLNKRPSKSMTDILEKHFKGIPQYLSDMDVGPLAIKKGESLILSGVGSSLAHAEYAAYLLKQKHPDMAVDVVPLGHLKKFKDNYLNRDQARLIFFSQGLSPQSWSFVQDWPYDRLILVTSVTKQNQDTQKASFIQELIKGHGKVVHYPLEDEYETLVRFVGPLCGLEAVYRMFPLQKSTEDQRLQRLQRLSNCLSSAEVKLPGDHYFETLKKESQMVLCASAPLSSLLRNIVCKLEEGAFLSGIKCVDYLEFAHGPFQNVEYQYYEKGHLTHFVLLESGKQDWEVIERCQKMLQEKYPVWVLSLETPAEDQIFECEMIFNQFLLKWIDMNGINQQSWYGKQQQHLLYESF